MLKITNFEAGEWGDLCGCVFFVSVIAFEDVNFLVDVLIRLS